MNPNVTRLLQSLEEGQSSASAELLPLVYDELRRLASARMAHESPDLTLQATALVHEAYMRLVGSHGGPEWENRRHFFAAAAEAMRRILIETARRRMSVKHGGGLQRHSVESLSSSEDLSPTELISLDEALSDLERECPVRAKLVKLRYFAGLSVEEAADALEISPSTAKRYWIHARAWLFRRLADNEMTRNLKNQSEY